jgi:hypothetical protein
LARFGDRDAQRIAGNRSGFWQGLSFARVSVLIFCFFWCCDPGGGWGRWAAGPVGLPLDHITPIAAEDLVGGAFDEAGDHRQKLQGVAAPFAIDRFVTHDAYPFYARNCPQASLR